MLERMSDLQLAPARDRSVLPALLIALLVLAVVAWAVFYFNPHKVSELKVTEVKTFAPQTQMGELAPAAHSNMRVIHNKSSYTAENDLYVVATVSITDKLRLPIFLNGANVDVTFADGSQVQTHMLALSDVKRLSTIFPAITPLAGNPLADDEEIAPGSTRVGTIVLPFPSRNAEAWSSKRNATLTVVLRNQEPQTTRLP